MAEQTTSAYRVPSVGEAAKRSSRWSLTPIEYIEHVSKYGTSTEPASPLKKFIQQRSMAKVRGISWNFTFAEWWCVWQESGRWEARGRVGYVMARRNDGDTPYSAGTVYICHSAQNTKDGIEFLSPAARIANTRAGRGKGYTLDRLGRKNPYVAEFRKRYLGRFATPELAQAAYSAAFESFKAEKAAIK